MGDNQPRGGILINHRSQEEMQIKKRIVLPLLILGGSLPLSAQFFAGRTNVAAWGAGVINVAAEMELNTHWSIDLPLYWGPLNKSYYKVGGVMTQPGLKYWFIKNHVRSFLCLSGTAAWFDIHRDPKWHKYGLWAGTGLSYGYSWPITKRINLVGEAGIGCYHATIHKRPYQVAYNEDQYIYRIRRWYVAPSRIELSISYLF